MPTPTNQLDVLGNRSRVTFWEKSRNSSADTLRHRQHVGDALVRFTTWICVGCVQYGISLEKFSLRTSPRNISLLVEVVVAEMEPTTLVAELESLFLVLRRACDYSRVL